MREDVFTCSVGEGHTHYDFVRDVDDSADYDITGLCFLEVYDYFFSHLFLISADKRCSDVMGGWEDPLVKAL